jgi:large subunit ribosomal protein L21e
MIKRKRLREKGKIKLSRYFQEFKNGEIVAVVRELALTPKFPKTIQGRSGKILEKRGECYVVSLNDLNKTKSYIIHPAHLKKI